MSKHVIKIQCQDETCNEITEYDFYDDELDTCVNVICSICDFEHTVVINGDYFIEKQ